MGELSIRVDRLGKKYRLGFQASRYKTLRDQLTTWAKTPWGRPARTAANREFWALKDVSFEVRRGEVVGVIGRNGAGKSTLLKILSRITEPTEGGADIHGRVGSLLEVGTGFNPELTGRENVFLNGAILGMTRSEITAKFDEIVAFAEVEKFIDTAVKHYSSGMYMRLAFAVAAHLEPEILVVDEVLAVGDAQFQKKCLGRMGEVSRQGRTVLFVSHNMQAVQALCQTALLLKAGQVAGHGPASELVPQYIREGAAASTRGTGPRPLTSTLDLIEAGFEPAVVRCGDSTRFLVRLRATADTIVDDLAVLIVSLSDVRVAHLDLRSADGPYRLKHGEVLQADVTIGRLNLVEGEYKFALHIGDSGGHLDTPDLGAIEVSAIGGRPVVPPDPIYRGYVELDYTPTQYTIRSEGA
jgi:lipopolysaccharide transport system ATP-binding protein